MEAARQASVNGIGLDEDGTVKSIETKFLVKKAQRQDKDTITELKQRYRFQSKKANITVSINFSKILPI